MSLHIHDHMVFRFTCMMYQSLPINSHLWQSVPDSTCEICCLTVTYFYSKWIFTCTPVSSLNKTCYHDTPKYY